ncbi:unnamed protein product [Malus baccata var. baccata]
MCMPFPSDLSLMGCEKDVVGDVAWSRGDFACGFAWSLRVQRGTRRALASVLSTLRVVVCLGVTWCNVNLDCLVTRNQANWKLYALTNIADSNLSNFEAEQGNEEFLFDMDCENARRDLLSKQDETLEEDEDRAEGITSQPNWYPTASKLSMPPKRTDVDGRSRLQRAGTIPGIRRMEMISCQPQQAS